MKFVIGNLLESKSEALVNTVNTVGVMGKGIALQFKERFPINHKEYVAACKSGKMKIGKMLVVRDHTTDGEKIIINFPTKTEWFRKSSYQYIEAGLVDLVHVIRDLKIQSIAIPPLGCGNGGLKWEKVKPLMEKYLNALEEVDVQIFEPNNLVKEILQAENQKKTVELTPARAMLLYSLFRYERFGEVASTFAANKLAYFLQRSGEPMKLKFIPYTYGPYALGVENVLYHLNGKYLMGLEQRKAKPFEPLKLNYERFTEVEEYVAKNLTAEQRRRVDSLFKVIEGFESTMSLEILASIDYLLAENKKLTVDDLLEKIQTWNDRKKGLIKREHVEIACQHLKNYSNREIFN